MANLASDAVVVVMVVVEMMSWISSSLLLTWRFLQIFDIFQIFQFSLEKMNIDGYLSIGCSGGGGGGWDDVLNYKQAAANLEVSPDWDIFQLFEFSLKKRSING